MDERVLCGSGLLLPSHGNGAYVYGQESDGGSLGLTLEMLRDLRRVVAESSRDGQQVAAGPARLRQTHVRALQCVSHKSMC